MMYIDLHKAIAQVPKSDRKKLQDATCKLGASTPDERRTQLANGSAIWRGAKEALQKTSSGKCWYTESRNPGFINTIDHFRPRQRYPQSGPCQYWYWWLGFELTNFRVSCRAANSGTTDPATAIVGGKGTHFPLDSGCSHAKIDCQIKQEKALLLDPCCEVDTTLLQFNPDGRPAIRADKASDPALQHRVTESVRLLSIDFSAINEDRERLYNSIKVDIDLGDALAGNTAALAKIQARFLDYMSRRSPYSKAAECYIRMFRSRPWIDTLFG